MNFRIYSFLLYLNHANMSHICTYYKGLMLMKKIVSSAKPCLLWYFVTIYRLNLMRMRGISYPLRRFISKFNFKVKATNFSLPHKIIWRANFLMKEENDFLPSIKSHSPSHGVFGKGLFVYALNCLMSKLYIVLIFIIIKNDPMIKK